MTRLKSKLLSFNSQKAVPTKIYSPANCEELRIPFKTDKIAKVVGKLASITPPVPRPLNADGEAEATYEEEEKIEMISGVLIQNDFKISLMAPEDLKEYAGLTTTTILCRQHINLSAAGIDLIRWALEGTFGAIKESKITDVNIDGKESKMNGNGVHADADEEVSRTETKFTVMDCVNVLVKNGGRVEVEWEGNVINDGIADAVLAVLFTVESSPAAVKRRFLPPLTNNPVLTLPQNPQSSTPILTPTANPTTRNSTPNYPTASNSPIPTTHPTPKPASPVSSSSSKPNSAKTPFLPSLFPATQPHILQTVPSNHHKKHRQTHIPSPAHLILRLIRSAPKTKPNSNACIT